MKPFQWIHFIDLDQDNFTGINNPLNLSNIGLIHQYPLEIRQNLANCYIEDVLNNPDLYHDKNLLLLLPLPQCPTEILRNDNHYKIYMNLLISCVKILALRPGSRLTIGCDWDEYNIAKYQTDDGSIRDLITEIFDVFRKYKVNLNRLTWLYCNTMIPTWIKERVADNESVPQTIYHAYYLYRLKNLDIEYQPTISNRNIKTHWILSLNRRASQHRLAFCFLMHCNKKRPNYISCRITLNNDPNDTYINDDYRYKFDDIKKYIEDNNQQWFEKPIIKRKSGIVSGVSSSNIRIYDIVRYNEFYNSLPWVLDHPPDLNNKGLSVNYQDSLPKNIPEATACYVATETFFDDDKEGYQGWVSEKTLKSFFYGLPTLWVAPHNTVQAIKNLGFKSYEGLLNENYDSEVDPKRRLSLIFDEVNRIQKIDDINAWYQQGMDIYLYNRNLLHQYMDQNIPEMIEQFHIKNCNF